MGNKIVISNIIKYHFRYIALELCSATLQDYVEKKLNFECTIDAVEVLRQATMGLSHLHSMDIGKLFKYEGTNLSCKHANNGH